jgi:4,5-DOPA dioxygenase extradiol
VANDTMPAAFIGHGSPRITLQHNGRTEAWRAFADSIPRPKAVVVISAHWYINATAVTAMARPRTIHDFFGAAPELFAFQYPAAGDPALAERIRELLAPTWVGLDLDSWGLDHGSWSVLSHFYPEADVPVVQLSVHGAMPFEYHLAVGAQLAPLRQEGILLIGSGTIIHNGRALDRAARESGDYERALEFDADVAEVMTTAPETAPRLRDHPGYKLGAPTDDHFLPLLYLAGLAVAADEKPSVLPDGTADGDDPLVRCYALGMPALRDRPGAPGASGARPQGHPGVAAATRS